MDAGLSEWWRWDKLFLSTVSSIFWWLVEPSIWWKANKEQEEKCKSDRDGQRDCIAWPMRNKCVLIPWKL